MKPDKDYLMQLVFLEISGMIQEDEQKYLQQVIAEDQEAMEIYTALHDKYSPSWLESQEAQLNSQDIWKEIQSRSNRVRRRRVLFAASVIVLLGIAAGGIFISQNRSSRMSMAADSPKPGILLHLTGGKTIDLSRQKGILQLGNLKLNNSNKQLSYADDLLQDQRASLSIPPGENYKVLLQDGSEIQLNAATEIEFPFRFSGSVREVSINGEAYLKIAQNSDKPFLVHLSGGLVVEVLGTEFNVNTYEKEMAKVALVIGKVRLLGAGDSMILAPGKIGVLKNSAAIDVQNFDAEAVLSWREGIIPFKDAKLNQVADLIYRYYGTKIKIEATANGSQTFTGAINRNKPLDNFLQGLKFAHFLNDYYYDVDSVLYLK